MSSYDVGYGKPPEATRFPKGRSGNPSGRKKGKLNIATIFHNVTQATISVTENGKIRVVTKFEAMLIQLMNKAVAGDLRAMRTIFDWSHVLSRLAEQYPDVTPDVEKNNMVLKQFIEQVRRATNEGELTDSVAPEEAQDDPS